MNFSKLYNSTLTQSTLLFLFAILVYSNTFNHGFGLDDNYIGDALKRSGETYTGVFKTYFANGEYRPISILTFLMEYKLLGSIEAGRSHIINSILYGLVCIGAYFFIIKLPVARNKYFAFLSVFIFIVLPVHSEVVSSLKNRDGILSMLFMLLSLNCFFTIYKYKSSKLSFNVSMYFLSILFLLLGFVSKLDSFNFLFIAILTIGMFYSISYKKVLFAIFIFSLLFNFRNSIADKIAEDSPIQSNVSFTENPIIENRSFPNRLSLLISTYVMYAKMMVDPSETLFYYGYNTVPLKKLLDVETILKLILLLGILFVGIYTFRENKLILYGILFFALSLIYASNFFVSVAGIVANRYAFIASLGYSIFAISLIDYVLNKLLSNIKEVKITKHKSTIITISILFISLVYSTYTIARNKDWDNEFTLFNADMPRAKDSFEANRIAISNVLYSALNQEKKETKLNMIKEALQYGLNAQKIYKENPYLNEKVGLAYINLGNWEAAKSSLLLNTKLEHSEHLSWEYLGDIYFSNEQKFDSAAYAYNQAIILKPNYDTPYFKYLNANYRNGKKKETYNFFKELEEKEPSNWIPSQCIGYFYLFEKDTLKGMQYIKTSFEKGFKDPSTANYVKDKLLQFGDIENSEKMNQFIQ